MARNDGRAFAASLAERAAGVLDACTRCGRCVEVCPMVEPAGLDAAQAPGIVSGVLDLIAGGAGDEDAARWADVCTGSGYCIPACPHGVNPRFMLGLARAASRTRGGERAARREGAEIFSGMSRGVRILSKMQLPPDLLARIGARRRTDPAPGRPAPASADGVAPALASDLPPTPDTAPAPAPDVVFYTGCNVLRTPHIALLCLDVLDTLGVRYEVMGGPSHCCGIFQYRSGDAAGAGRVGFHTIARLGGAGASEVLSWCPSCQTQFGEVTLPSYAETNGGSPFDLTPYIQFVADRLDRLAPLMVHRVERRAALHERPVLPKVVESARRILNAIPGLELVDLDVPRVGTMSNTLSVLPDFKTKLREREFGAAEAAGVDTLATIFHACHREICHFESGRSFEIVNFMELLGESLGLRREDVYKRLKLMQDVDAIVRDSEDLIVRHGLDLEQVREVIHADMVSGRSVGVSPVGADAREG